MGSKQMSTCEKVKSGVELMLEEWASWSASDILNGLGYSRFSNIGWLVETGGLIIHTTGPRRVPDNFIAEEMDSWLVELKSVKPLEADAIIAYYLSGYFKERVARKFQISVRMLEVRIKFAKTWLEGRYAGRKESYL
jgi:ECF sigma factor